MLNLKRFSVFFLVASMALAQSAGADCPHNSTPDSLAALAQACAKDLTSNVDCRGFANDENEDYVITKDCSPKKPAGYLIIPLKPVTGIEDSKAMTTPVVDIWKNGWAWAMKFPGKPASRTALAINSKNARSQNRLHVHMSCVLPGVSAALESAHVPLYPAKPVILKLGPDKNAYVAVKVSSLSGDSNPFRVIQSFPGVAGDMQDQSIAVVGSQDGEAYYVLNTTTSGNNRGHAEELLDQTCVP